MARQTKSLPDKPQQTRSLNSIGFVQADILNENTDADDHSASLAEALDRLRDDSYRPHFDVLISNPPYISPRSFQRTTSRSVRRYEPRLALVPSGARADDDEAIGDIFYPKLLNIAEQVQTKWFQFEVSDMDQARRVAAMASAHKIWTKVEIWRDEPDVPTIDEERVAGQTVKIRGRGHGRSVFAYRGEAVEWFE